MAPIGFNSRPCERGDGAIKRFAPPESLFQFTPLREGRPSRSAAVSTPSRSCFNSRPCERGDGDQGGLYSRRRVSIHAPARGATVRGAGRGSRGRRSFNSRPCERGDAAWMLLMRIVLGFQFTPLREGRPCYGAVSQVEQAVSIHAPARGATPLSSASRCSSCVFQFTPLREGRLQLSAPSSCQYSFNSRPCERGDTL